MKPATITLLMQLRRSTGQPEANTAVLALPTAGRLGTLLAVTRFASHAPDTA
jgi:hypothetical protein